MPKKIYSTELKLEIVKRLLLHLRVIKLALFNTVFI